MQRLRYNQFSDARQFNTLLCTSMCSHDRLHCAGVPPRHASVLDVAAGLALQQHQRFVPRTTRGHSAIAQLRYQAGYEQRNTAVARQQTVRHWLRHLELYGGVNLSIRLLLILLNSCFIQWLLPKDQLSQLSLSNQIPFI